MESFPLDTRFVRLLALNPALVQVSEIFCPLSPVSGGTVHICVLDVDVLVMVDVITTA